MHLPAVLVAIFSAVVFVGAADVRLGKRAGCNADNCLRALEGNSVAASSFCATYSTMTSTATTGFPTYIPTSCGASRVSSACTYLATSTSASPACSTGQVVVNPSFYGLPPDYISDIAPWTIEHEIGIADPGCFYDLYSYNDAARDQYFGDPRSM